MKNGIKNLLRSNKGAGLAMAIFAAAALITGTVAVYKSGAFQNKESLDTKQRQIISRTLQDMKSILANQTHCKTSMEAVPAFSRIGSYIVGSGLGSKVNITAIDSVQAGRDYNITVRFSKTNEISKLNTTQIAYLKAKLLQSQTTPVTNYCVSYETTGAEDSYLRFCQSTGGVFDAVAGICDYDNLNSGFADTNFRTRLIDYACSVIGGNALGTMCNKVNVPGTIHSQTYLDSSPKIDLGVDDRDGFVNFSCAANEISTGFTQNGQLSCATLDCNSFTGADPNVYSNYSLDTSLVGSQNKLVCKCDRDFKFKKNVNGKNTAPASPVPDTGGGDNMPASFGCGNPDPNSCIDYDHDDGCGTATTCRLIRGKFPGCSQTTTSKQEILINSCGDICALGPGCTTSSCPASPPLPPAPTTCSATTTSGCDLPIAGANSTGVNGTCSVNSSVTCTADCNSSGSWTNVNNSSCSAKVNGACGSTKETCSAGQFSDVTDTTSEYLWKCLGSSGGSDVSCTSPKAAPGCSATETEYTSMSACTADATGCRTIVSGAPSYGWRISSTTKYISGNCSIPDGGSCGGQPETKNAFPRPDQFGFVCDSSSLGAKEDCYHCGTGTYDKMEHEFECKNTAANRYCGVKNSCTYDWNQTGYSTSCFIGETQIQTTSSYTTPISELKTGDIVLNGEGEEVIVKSNRKFTHLGKKYSINGSEYFFTDSHPFKSSRGWLAIDPNEAVKVNPDLQILKMQVGDTLILKDKGEVKVLTIDSKLSPESVYSIEVSGTHEYIANGFVVHNKVAAPTDSCGNGGMEPPASAVCDASKVNSNYSCLYRPNSGSSATTTQFKCQSSCAAPPVINGECSDPDVNYSCKAGTSTANTDGATAYTWSCVGSGGGSTASCSEAKAVNGVCGASLDQCTAGTWRDNTTGTGANQWFCDGSGGGTNASCSTSGAACTINAFVGGQPYFGSPSNTLNVGQTVRLSEAEIITYSPTCTVQDATKYECTIKVVPGPNQSKDFVCAAKTACTWTKKYYASSKCTGSCGVPFCSTATCSSTGDKNFSTWCRVDGLMGADSESRPWACECK